ncbi:MAG: putative peptide maturation dehydrogenase, partial [Lysobacteraceae bacterium]
QWTDARTLPPTLERALRRLLRAGLVVGSTRAHAAHRARDERLRDTHWHPLAATLHAFTRWDGTDAVKNMQDSGTETALSMRHVLGAPPAEAASRGAAADRLPLPRADRTGFDALLARRATCRNFDAARPLPRALFAQLLERVFAAQAQVRGTDDTVVLKKHHPSGGGLHPLEAYLLVQHVEGIAPGLYHYHALEHALQPLPWPWAAAGAAAANAAQGEVPTTAGEEPDHAAPSRAGRAARQHRVEGETPGASAAAPSATRAGNADVAPADLHAFAMQAVAQQHWFANAHALVLIAPRFARMFWKYRRHAKAYRVIALEAGHLSQNLYLAATDAGLGAFITGAINERVLEQAFGLDPLCEGALAVCGFGWRGGEMVTAEFDPGAAVWQAA